MFMIFSDESDHNSRKYSELKDFDPCNAYPSDRGHFKNELSDNLIEVLARHGSCQPSKMIKTQGGQTFNPAYYYYR